ncbi:hypothetical protein FOL47_009385 [Perkinsus chesapeaki]|uniref:Uncharacterized protein n=1 Tax=Perkinsus chesapeaki TaxID=330153 RepID=A0A7J6L8N7_PERCH|nr:hypothetical protein FOL47_009385 [Perkinsus chesapeaki]
MTLSDIRSNQLYSAHLEERYAAFGIFATELLSSSATLTPREKNRSRVLAKSNEEKALKWARKRKSMVEAARAKNAAKLTGVLTEEHTFQPDVLSSRSSLRSRSRAASSPASGKLTYKHDTPQSSGKGAADSESRKGSGGIVIPQQRRGREVEALQYEVESLRLALGEALVKAKKWKCRCKKASEALAQAESVIWQQRRELSDLRRPYRGSMLEEETVPEDIAGRLCDRQADSSEESDKASMASELTASFGERGRSVPQPVDRSRSPSPDELQRMVYQLGICRVSAVEGVECGCFPLFGGHKKRSGGANRNSSDNQHRRSGSEVEVQDDERIEDDLRMLELRLRQWQRQRQHLDEDSKPLAVLLVISDFDRKMDIDRREHIFTKDEKQDLKNRHTLLSASVDSLWDKWGPRGENILDDKVTTSWDGDKLHSVITDLSTRLAHAYTTTARLPEDAT